MKLHEPTPPKDIIRITFRKKDHSLEYLMLDETTIQEVEDFVKSVLVQSLKPDIFYKGHHTGMDIRAYKGAKAGKSKSISIKHPVTPLELKGVILKAILDK